MKKEIKIGLVLLFTLMGYLLTHQLIVALLCFLLSFLDLFFFVSKKEKENRKEEKKEELDMYLLQQMTSAYDGFQESYQKKIEEIEYLDLDTGTILTQFQSRNEKPYLFYLEEARKRRKEANYQSYVRTELGNLKRKKEEREVERKKREQNTFLTLLLCSLCIVGVRLFLNPYFLILEQEQSYSIVILFYLILYWGIIHTIVTTRKEASYEIIDFANWKK